MHGIGLMALATSGCALHHVDPPLAAWASSEAAGPHTVAAVHDGYRVLGQTPRTVRRSLNRRSTWRDVSGERFDGGTKWSLQWRHAFDTGPDGCRILDLQFSGTITVTTPSLRTLRLPDPKLSNRWQAYLTALWAHEQHHVARVYDAMSEARSTVQTLPPAPTCATAGMSANLAIQTVFQAMNIDQVAYDTTTGHGEAEGAFWDVPEP